MPPSGPSSGRPSAERGRAHARIPVTCAPATAGRKRAACASNPGASAAGSGRASENVEPTAETPRAVTAENSASGTPAALVSALIPASSSTCRGGSGSASSTTTPHENEIGTSTPPPLKGTVPLSGGG